MSGLSGAGRKVLVFGAGPAGMTAAVMAARLGASVTLIEKTDRVGRKLSMTGNGRANLSNLELAPEAYNAAARERMTRWLSVCGHRQTDAFFSSLGLYTRAEGHFLYPVSGQAGSVVCALGEACRRLGVRLVTGAQLKRITRADDGYLCEAGGRRYAADAVVLATGALSGPKSCQASGDAYYICERLGLSCVPRHPALVPLMVDDKTLPAKTGVRVWGEISFYACAPGVFSADRPPEEACIASEFGEIQYTVKSISGMPVLQASGGVAAALSENREVWAVADLLCELTRSAWEKRIARLESLAEKDDTQRLLPLLGGIGNEELNRCFLRRLGFAEDEERVRFKTLSDEQRAYLWRMYRAFPVRIAGVGGYERAQATAGGVALREIDDDCQCVRAPGLYLAGELVDVDGRCGGYNLQWAFMSGMFAGVHAASGRSFAPDDAEG